MTDEQKPLRVHGTPQPKSLKGHLQEVKVDAARNAVENLKRQAEAREFEEAKARGITPEEIISKGKTDLVNKGFLEGESEDRVEVNTQDDEYGEFEEDTQTEDSNEPVKLDGLKKAELQEVAKREEVEVDENATVPQLKEAIEASRKGSE